MANSFYKEKTRQSQQLNTVLHQPETRRMTVASPKLGRSATPQVVNYSSAVTPTAINQQDRMLIKQAEEERKAQKTPTAINREDSQKIKAAEEEKSSQQTQATTPKQGTSTGSNGYVSTAPLREAETTPVQTEKVSQPTQGLIGFGSIGPAPIVTWPMQAKTSTQDEKSITPVTQTT